ncbi:QueT transporter family protein [Companilactobacillus mishanensis]|uniref:QueT transporter family protein n=1 Tax=Companilactobacillus mishanensis TaxID=2486008 RepID=A0A5P0ZI32_9LACO|nr:QueT transporter family protein [Companilactobacillus mishanensis]MQS52720.1 QueT transporter family protein [Companilactobacillus mishanensis]
MKNFTRTSSSTVQTIVSTAVIAAMYVAVTFVLQPLSFGAIQVRMSEMFNYLVLFNKKYVWGVTLGVFLANFMSPTWALDVPIGTIATLLVLFFVLWITKFTKDLRVKFIITAVVFAFSMFTVAGELFIAFKMPFWFGWLTIGIGELLSMSIGGMIMYAINSKLDLSRF